MALSVPIRVFGVDYRGIDFTEEAFTIIVNLHGAKIRMTHQLLPDSEIRLISHPTGQDSLFRVVSKLQSPELQYTYWGVENLDPEKNIWGVDIPELQPGDQAQSARWCSSAPPAPPASPCARMKPCWRRFEEKGGVERTCMVCNAPGLWKLLPFQPV